MVTGEVTTEKGLFISTAQLCHCSSSLDDSSCPITSTLYIGEWCQLKGNIDDNTGVHVVNTSLSAQKAGKGLLDHNTVEARLNNTIIVDCNLSSKAGLEGMCFKS